MAEQEEQNGKGDTGKKIERLESEVAELKSRLDKFLSVMFPEPYLPENKAPETRTEAVELPGDIQTIAADVARASVEVSDLADPLAALPSSGMQDQPVTALPVTSPIGPRIPDLPLDGAQLGPEPQELSRPLNRRLYRPNPDFVRVYIRMPVQMDVDASILDLVNPTQRTILELLCRPDEKAHEALSIKEMLPAFGVTVDGVKGYRITIAGLALAVDRLKNRSLVERVEDGALKGKYRTTEAGVRVLGLIVELSKDNELRRIREAMKIRGTKEALLRAVSSVENQDANTLAKSIRISTERVKGYLIQMRKLGLVERKKIGTRSYVYNIRAEGREVIDKLEKMRSRIAAITVLKELKVTELEVKILRELLVRETREKGKRAEKGTLVGSQEGSDEFIGVDATDIGLFISRTRPYASERLLELKGKGLADRVTGRHRVFYYKINEHGIEALKTIGKAKDADVAAPATKPLVQEPTATDSTDATSIRSGPPAEPLAIQAQIEPKVVLLSSTLPEHTEGYYIARGLEALGKTPQESSKHEDVLLALSERRQLTALEAGRLVTKTIGGLYDDEALAEGKAIMLRLAGNMFARCIDLENKSPNKTYEVTGRGHIGASIIAAKRGAPAFDMREVLTTIARSQNGITGGLPKAPVLAR